MPAEHLVRQHVCHRFHHSCEVLTHVHCKAGVSRSPTIVIAYLMYACRMSLSEAYSTVRAVRPVISPNLDFMGHLVRFQKTLEGRKDARVDVLSLSHSHSHSHSHTHSHSQVDTYPSSSSTTSSLGEEGEDGMCRMCVRRSALGTHTLCPVWAIIARGTLPLTTRSYDLRGQQQHGTLVRQRV